MKRLLILLTLGFCAAPLAAAADRPLRELVDETLRTAAKQYEFALSRLPANNQLPRTFENGRLVTVPTRDWTSGFFPGALWYLYEATGDNKWREAAEKYTALLEPEQHNTRTHDVGFMLYCSFGNGLRLTRNPAYRDVLLNGAASLSTRFNPTVGSLQSWDARHGWDFPVIVDNMMNLELLFWAEKAQPDKPYGEIARAHADTTLRNHFRPDHSSYHVVDYDPATGKPDVKVTHQGAADDSAWARGQAWGLYGFTVMYRETREERHLDQAKKIAAFFMDHPRLPADKIPYWDFDAPGIPDAPRDSSAAAIVCSALLELRRYVDRGTADRYRSFAEEQLRSLASPAYFSAPGQNGGFLLKHATGHMPRNSEVDVPLIYGDYYFLEALLRARDLARTR